MIKKVLELNKSILVNCVEKCLQNARELFEEAELLKDNKKYPRAYTLYHLCNEEIGKVFIIFQYLIQNDYSEEKVKKFYSEFTNHKPKIKTSRNILTIMLLLIQKEISEDDYNNLSYTKEAIDKLNNFKNLSLYSFIKNKSAFKPSDIFGLDEVNLIRPNCELGLNYSEKFCRLALNDIDLFIKMTNEN